MNSESVQALTLSKLNTILVTLSDTITRNAKFVKYGMVIGRDPVAAGVAAVKAL